MLRPFVTLSAAEAALVVDALIAFREQKVDSIKQINALPMFRDYPPLDEQGFRIEDANELIKRIEACFGRTAVAQPINQTETEAV